MEQAYSEKGVGYVDINYNWTSLDLSPDNVYQDVAADLNSNQEIYQGKSQEKYICTWG